MSKKLKRRLRRIIICAVAFGILKTIEIIVGRETGGTIPLLHGYDTWCFAILYLAVYIGIGADVVKDAVTSIFRGNMLDENFLMVLASVGAFFIGSYSEGVAVMLFFQVGEWFQSYAVGKSRKSIKELMNIRPDYANVIRDGEEITVDPDEVAIGETIIVKPGEKIPLDGNVIEGTSALDTMALTGESIPLDVEAGAGVFSGCINLSGVVKIEVTKSFGESTVSKILELVESATDKKSESENFITKFARWYTPCIVGCAVLIAVIPPIVMHGGWMDWLYRALSFLVISCPCALVISIPLGFFGGIGGASKEGILVKGSCFIEQLAEAGIVAMDKTGTLTKGEFEVSKIVVCTDGAGQACAEATDAASEHDLLMVAALAESYSSHPIAKSLIKACESELDKNRLGEVSEIAGHGVEAHIDNICYYVGNEKLLRDKNIAYREVDEPGTVIFVANDAGVIGYIVVSDMPKEDAKSCIDGLKASGVDRIVMLTGDRERVAADIASRLGIKEYYAGLLPGDKVDITEHLLKEKKRGKKLLFVGDGINDAPVLARADIGIAMGGLGADAAIEAADIVIMTDEPSKIAKAMRISRKTLRIVKENIVFAIGVKLLILILAALGIATMWAAVFADVGVAFIAILNAMRAMRTK